MYALIVLDYYFFNLSFNDNLAPCQQCPLFSSRFASSHKVYIIKEKVFNMMIKYYYYY